jgi:hypothetical protein
MRQPIRFKWIYAPLPVKTHKPKASGVLRPKNPTLVLIRA